MKLVFRQYLASLRERRELDAVLPDLLSELGYTVLSRPSIGTRQYGVDVAALSPADETGKQRLYLFSIKQGDLTRADWDGNPQALRSSINEIIDVYIPTRIAPAHRGKDIVICLCFGGDVQEAVRDSVSLFTDAREREKVGLSFEEWNGDRLAGLLVDGVLREQLVSEDLRSNFQKAVAMLDEPDVAFTHFAELIAGLCSVEDSTPRQRTTILRQLYICLWVLFVWARDAGNLEAPFRASERALLFGWSLVHEDIGRSNKASQDIGLAYRDLVDLHHRIWDSLIGGKILPFAEKEHAISVAVHSASPVDVTLKLFEVMGRTAMQGLWHLWAHSGTSLLPEARSDWESEEATEIAQRLVLLIRNNQILLNPITDHQATDIAVTLLFLTMMGAWKAAAKNYAEGVIQRVTFAHRTHGRYPTLYGDYRVLLQHPREQTEEYRKAQTKASTLYPLLCVWIAALEGKDAAEFLEQFAEKHLEHCTSQFWLPGEDSERKIYIGDNYHGIALSGIPITADAKEARATIDLECQPDSHFMKLSAVALGHWPILVLACRHYRLPLPPQLWIAALDQARSDTSSHRPKRK